MGLLIERFAALTDNYNYLITDQDTNTTAAVDPSKGTPLLTAVKETSRKIDFVLVTHHHHDHTGGIAEIKNDFNSTVIGPAYENIPYKDQAVKDGDMVNLGASWAEVLHIPGHTLGHIAYWFKEARALFIGDTLFAMGCGRLFEGTAEQMFESLQRIKRLPDDTMVYCAHEYTLKNGEFALTVEAGNQDLQQRMRSVRWQRQRLEPTVPFALGIEKQTNPFLRPTSPEIRSSLGANSSVSTLDVFTQLRARRNQF